MPEEALHTRRKHDPVDSRVWDHRKVMPPHIKYKGIILGIRDCPVKPIRNEQRDKSDIMPPVEIQQRIQSRNNPAAAAPNHRVGGKLLTAAVAFSVFM